MPEQFLVGSSVTRNHTGSRGDRYEQRLPVHCEMVCHKHLDILVNLPDALPRPALHQKSELIPVQAVHLATRRQKFGNTGGDQVQRPVTKSIAVLLIDIFKVINIQHHNNALHMLSAL